MCRACKQDLPLSSFHKKLRGAGGVGTLCSPCATLYARERRARYAPLNAHLREEVDPRANELKRCPTCARTLRRRNFHVSIGTKDGLQAQCRPCHARAIAALSANRYASKKGCIGKVTPDELTAMLAIQGDMCARCGASLTPNTRCLDHIIPAGPGVLHRPSNLQYLCRGCNARKVGRSTDSRLPEWVSHWPQD